MRLFHRQEHEAPLPVDRAASVVDPGSDPIEVMRQQLDQLSLSRTAREEELSRERQTHDEDVRERDRLLADTIASWESTVAELVAEHEAARNALQESHAQERDADRAQWQAKVTELEGASAAVIASLRSEVTHAREQAAAIPHEVALAERIERIARDHLCAQEETDLYLIGANDAAVAILDALDEDTEETV